MATCCICLEEKFCGLCCSTCQDGKICSECLWTYHDDDEALICPVCRSPHTTYKFVNDFIDFYTSLDWIELKYPVYAILKRNANIMDNEKKAEIDAELDLKYPNRPRLSLEEQQAKRKEEGLDY